MTAHGVSRRRTLSLLFLGSLGAARRARGATADYAEDVDYLLTQFGLQAGALLKLKKIEWGLVAEEFREEVKKVADDAAHVKLCNRLVARLRDGHAWIADLKVKLPAEGGGKRYTGPRVHLVMIGNDVFVRQAFCSAQEAGVVPGMQVESIDGVPIAEWLRKKVKELSDERGYSTDHTALYYACHAGLADWEGTTIRLQVRRGEEPSKEISLVREGGPNFVPIGPIFPPAKLERIGRQSYGRTEAGHAYIHLRDIPGDLPTQLDQILAKLADAPGLVLDFRANGGGGCDHEAVFGRFLPAGQNWRGYASAGASPFAKPVVTIVDAGVRSAGETVSGIFKEDGRGLMIGDTPTAGTSSQKTKVTVPSGMFSVQFSVASNKGRFNGGRGIEGIGVAPQVVTPYVPADLLAGVDTQIRVAEEYLKKGVPKELVAWGA